jgi:hypothetical protein
MRFSQGARTAGMTQNDSKCLAWRRSFLGHARGGLRARERKESSLYYCVQKVKVLDVFLEIRRLLGRKFSWRSALGLGISGFAAVQA